MFYFEQTDFSGTPRPQSSPDHPLEGKSKMSQSKIGSISAIKSEHAGLSLDVLKIIYGPLISKEVKK